MDIKQLDNTYIANTYSRASFVAMSGKGALVRDEDGKEYIDLGSGIAVNSFGICDDEWTHAVEEQLHKIQHISNLYYTEPQARLAQMLCERTDMKKVFFGNSGAEANECAIKCARKYSSDKYGARRSTIITLIDSFHGRTMAALSATGQESMHVHFGPFLEGFKYAPANNFAALEALCDGTVCAVMLELVQGESGVNPLDKAYVDKVAALCAERDILLIVDEVQTGNGRTGSLYAYMQYGIKPDIVSTAKGLAGGLPLGCTMLGEKVENTLSAGTHGSTFGGNPICAAGAISIISRIDDALLEEVKKKGEYIKSELEKAP
ncbi:MAG: aminotransferase class III-fold pyridoxal phosphate-dependent enzyme, partial [Oscillospiraceae bacterium]